MYTFFCGAIRERNKETGAEGHRTKEGEVGRNVSMLTLEEMLPMGK